jgi:hypothetical protein
MGLSTTTFKCVYRPSIKPFRDARTEDEPGRVFNTRAVAHDGEMTSEFFLRRFGSKRFC